MGIPRFLFLYQPPRFYKALPPKVAKPEMMHRNLGSFRGITCVVKVTLLSNIIDDCLERYCLVLRRVSYLIENYNLL